MVVQREGGYLQFASNHPLRQRQVKNPGPRSTCPIGTSLDLLGDRWTLLVMRDLLLAGRTRFGELGASESIATNVLSERLRRLEGAGVVTKHRDPNDGRRFVYRATPRGADLIPLLLELGCWGASHTPAGTAHPELIEQARHDRDTLVATLRARALAS